MEEVPRVVHSTLLGNLTELDSKTMIMKEEPMAEALMAMMMTTVAVAADMAMTMTAVRGSARPDAGKVAAAEVEEAEGTGTALAEVTLETTGVMEGIRDEEAKEVVTQVEAELVRASFEMFVFDA